MNSAGVEVDPIAAVGLDALREEVVAAAIELAQACNFGGHFCSRCLASSAPNTLLVHVPDCPAGKILAYVEAVNEARMGAERRRENRSLLIHDEFREHRPRQILTHFEAAKRKQAEASFPLVPVVVDHVVMERARSAAR